MRKIITLSLAGLAAFGVAGAAYAQADNAGAPARAPLTRAQVQERTAERFGRMDANDDGVLNQADREARQKAMFDRIDADHNGAISFAEFSAQRENRAEARGERREQRADRRGPGGPGPRGMRGGPEGPRAADADKDGTVTQAEFTGAALARFDRADANKDGTITREERRGMRGEGRRGPGRAPRPAPDAG